MSQNSRTVLVVPVPDASRLAAACALVNIDADVVPLGAAGSAVVPVAGADAGEAGRRLSRVLGRADVLALHHAEGQVRAERWQRGTVRETPAPGLAMSAVPGAVERLLLTDVQPSAMEGAVTSVGLPRSGAVRGLRGAGGSRMRRWDGASTVVLGVAALGLAAVESPRAATGEGSWVVVVLALLVVAWTALRLLRRRP